MFPVVMSSLQRSDWILIFSAQLKVVLVQVLEEGSWSDAVDGALSKLNCKILDPKLLNPRQHEKVCWSLPR